MFLFWDLTSPSPPGEGGRKVRGYEGHSSDLPGAFPSVLLPPTPSWVLPPESVRLPCSHQIAVAVLMSWSCPYSKLILGWDLPQTGPLKASTLASAVLACRIQQLCSPGQPDAAVSELMM